MKNDEVPSPLGWQEAKAEAEKTIDQWRAQYGEDGMRVILRAIQRLYPMQPKRKK